jgi:hypothetical protein
MALMSLDTVRELLELSQRLNCLTSYYNEEPLVYSSATLRHEIYKFYTAFSYEVPTEGVSDLCRGLLENSTVFVASMTAKHAASSIHVKEKFDRVLREFIGQLRKLVEMIAAMEKPEVTAQLVGVTVEYLGRVEAFSTENQVGLT